MEIIFEKINFIFKYKTEVKLTDYISTTKNDSTGDWVYSNWKSMVSFPSGKTTLTLKDCTVDASSTGLLSTTDTSVWQR